MRSSHLSDYTLSKEKQVTTDRHVYGDQWQP
jgi:hypothetical protein